MGSFVSFAVMWESETPDPITFPFPLNNEYMNVRRFLSIEPSFYDWTAPTEYVKTSRLFGIVTGKWQ